MTSSGYGWHVDAGTQMLHMVLAGIFGKLLRELWKALSQRGKI